VRSAYAALRVGACDRALLDDPAIAEVMLNPDGRLWIDRLSGGLVEMAKNEL
jgi:type IV secretion system protein VirB11